jgi:hypothetical protein
MIARTRAKMRSTSAHVPDTSIYFVTRLALCVVVDYELAASERGLWWPQSFPLAMPCFVCIREERDQKLQHTDPNGKVHV